MATALFFLGFTYLFLLDQARYLNHFYFLILVSFLLILVPANRAFSLDALLGPKRADQRIPAWSVWILRFQLLVLYGFAGIAKLNGDWLRGEPLRGWLCRSRTHSVVGRLFQTELAPVSPELRRAPAWICSSGLSCSGDERGPWLSSRSSRSTS